MKRLLLAVLLTLPLSANAADATVCGACHGLDGVSVIPGYPNLAGQNELYLTNQLKLFRAKERTGGSAQVMWGMATALSDEDIAALAKYYSELSPAKKPVE